MNNKQNLELLNNEISWFDINESIKNMGYKKNDTPSLEKVINTTMYAVCLFAVLYYGYYLLTYISEFIYLIK